MLKILDIANEPVRKTHILYSAGINFYQLSRYLDLLLKTGMMEEVQTPYVAYRTTEKGRVLMKLFSASEIAAAVTSAPAGGSRGLKAVRQALGPEGFI